MSTNYIILMFYITVEAAAGGVLEKKVLSENNCPEICRVELPVKVLTKYL